MSFEELMGKIKELDTLDNVNFFVVGQSLLGEIIYGAHIGSYSGKQILLEGAIHAREYITALLLVEQVKNLRNQKFEGGMYFIPLVNPDGVKLVLNGIKSLHSKKLIKFLTGVNGGSNDFSLWKANANAVDLNVNFNALWGGGAQNVFSPSPSNFVGYYPNSEREVKMLIDFTYFVKPALTISYHSKGEVIYYGFEVLTPEEIERDKQIAIALATKNGYEAVKTEKSTGGYSDWISQNLHVPAFTIEVGNDEFAHPIGADKLSEIFEKNKDIPLIALSQVQTKE